MGTLTFFDTIKVRVPIQDHGSCEKIFPLLNSESFVFWDVSIAEYFNPVNVMTVTNSSQEASISGFFRSLDPIVTQGRVSRTIGKNVPMSPKGPVLMKKSDIPNRSQN
jgi:hypothetical protein